MYQKMDLRVIGLLLAWALSPESVFAKEGPSPLHLYISESVQQVDNANRNTTKEGQIDELQTTTDIRLDAQFDQYEKWQGGINYRWSQTEYNKDTQVKKPALTGNTNILFGSAVDFYSVNLIHTSRELLINPSDTGISSNLDSKNSLTAALSLKTKRTRPSQFALTLAQTHIIFDTFKQNNTERSKADINFSRRMTPLNSGGINLSHTEVVYPDHPKSDFQSNLLFTYFQRQLRTLNYYVAFGLNKSQSELSDDNSPYAQLRIAYSSGANRLSFDASSEMTDNSQGSNNQGATNASNQQVQNPETGEVSSDGSLTVRDQIERNTINLSFSSSSPCSKCSLSIQGSYFRDEYLNTPSANSLNASTMLGFAYRLRSSTSLKLDIKHSEFKLTAQPDTSGYDQNTARATWSWQARSSLSTSVFMQALKRDNNTRGHYSSNSVGVSISYQLI